ncbi:MAG TPA: MarR family transcriptional regulator [Kofleriaceae bacterium]
MNSLRRVVRLLRLADRAAESAVRISAAQLFVLRSLVEAPAASLSELAARTLTDQSSVSTVVARLVDAKLVNRIPSKDDRRRMEIAITPAGMRLVKKAPPTPQAKMIAAIKKLPAAKQADIAKSLEALVKAVGADETAPRMFFDA